MHVHSRPVSGLAGFDVSPSHELENSQWHQKNLDNPEGVIRKFLFDTPAPAYRCGGSPGISGIPHESSVNGGCMGSSLTWFPFNSAAKRPQHLERGRILPEWEGCG